jgi:hypothetical protein
MKAQNTQPSMISLKLNYTSRPTTCPPPPQALAKMAEVLAQLKPIEVPHTSLPPQAPSPMQDIQGDVTLEQVQLQDWE